MTGRIKGIVAVALVLIVAGVVVMWTFVLPERSVDLDTFSKRVGSPGSATGSFSERSIVGALAYSIARVTSGRVDDFWALTGHGQAMASLTFHAQDGRSQNIAVDVVDTSTGQSGLASCHAGPRCTVTTPMTGATLAVEQTLYGTGVKAVLTDPDRHLHVDVQAQGTLLTADQIAAVAGAQWWALGAPRNIVTASRRLKVQHIATGFTD